MTGAGAVKPMTPLSHQLQIEKLSKELASKDAELASLRNEHSRQEPRLIALRDANRRLERQVSPVSALPGFAPRQHQQRHVDASAKHKCWACIMLQEDSEETH